MPEIRFAFLCEDLRPEAGGLTTAVGIMGERLDVAILPGQLRSLAYFIRIHNPERIAYATALRLAGPFGPGVPTDAVVGTLPVPDPGFDGSNLLVQISPVPLTAPGVITASYRIESDPPVEVHTHVEVRLGGATVLKRVPLNA